MTAHQPLSIPERVLAGDFGGWLRKAMDERRMSYRMLGMLTGVDHSTLCRLASGSRLPSLATAVAIIRVLQRPTSLREPAHADAADRIGVAGGAS